MANNTLMMRFKRSICYAVCAFVFISFTFSGASFAAAKEHEMQDAKLANESLSAESVFLPKPFSGAVFRLFSKKNAKRIPVITYHKFVSPQEWENGDLDLKSLYMKSTTFRQQMRWLHKHKYRTISTEEFYNWYIGRIILPKKSVLITIDDGNYSVIKYALPVLKQYDMKATFFIIGKSVDEHTDITSKNGRYESVGADVINEIRETYPKLEFQSHTYNMHRKIEHEAALAKTSYEEQKQDFTYMYDQYQCTFMAYPYGTYKPVSMRAAMDSNVKIAFTYGKNAFATKKQNRYAIRRIKISSTQSMKMFYRWFVEKKVSKHKKHSKKHSKKQSKKSTSFIRTTILLKKIH